MATRRTTPAKKHAPTVRAMRLSPDERREQLLRCAITVFASHGLVAANHGMVATAAKVSVPTVFFYFKTRDALVDAVLAEVERFYASAFASANDMRTPAIETLAALSQALTNSLETHADYARIMREWSVSVRSDIWPRYLRLYRRMNRVLAKVIERGQREGSFRADLDPDDEAAILYAGSTALIQMMETGASAERLDRFQRAMIQGALVQKDRHSGTRAAKPAAVKSAARQR
jgi:TetR/AcrR family hemagglutinin/protease transcriptional regulator